MIKKSIYSKIVLVIVAISLTILFLFLLLNFIFDIGVFQTNAHSNTYTVVTTLISIGIAIVVSSIIGFYISRILTQQYKKTLDGLDKEIGAIKDNFEKTLSIFNHLTDGIIVFDAEGKVTMINAKALELLDSNEKDVDFEYFSSRLNLDISFEELVYVESAKNRSENVMLNDRYLDIEFVVHFEGQERANSIITVIKECTEQIRLEDMRKDFIANVSHELKTPLTSISSYTEALMDGAVSDPELCSKFLDVILEETKSMSHLIKDLLQLSQIDRRGFPLNKRRHSFEQVIKSCVERVRIDAENHNQTLECYVIGDIPEIYMDSERIKQVLLNVLSNAIKYTPGKGNINVYIGKTITQVYVKTSDTGIGIPRESLDRIFERFYRVDKARTREQGGTGLGLAISKEIVEAHNGEISVTSEFGVGTEVTVKLPIYSKPKANHIK